MALDDPVGRPEGAEASGELHDVFHGGVHILADG
jgi:hypothetical protein